MRQHDNAVIGFGGRVAYYNEFFGSFANQSAYAVTLGSGGFTEVTADRVQTPSHWSGAYTNTALGLRAGVRKFITHENVAVTTISVTNTGTVTRTVPVVVDSPFTRTAAGAELTGVHDVLNSRGERLTRIFPRLSGQGLSPSGGRLQGSVDVPTVALFAFLVSWNEFFAPLILLNSTDRFTVTLAVVNLRTATHGAVDYAALEAGVVVMAMPCVLLFLFLQRGYVRGFMSGALRG
ncbi:carbohydrate ABC transporter permease [Actinophytocola xanthii]|uniref:carbohydrate ABC transporter permease n=1 Tax=Actinophytocola xanthii TaxID=1912961 RepID=UPI0018E989FF|nr:carbohydrate ABC transporter permease [Actinophytocola xanthii]